VSSAFIRLLTADCGVQGCQHKTDKEQRRVTVNKKLFAVLDSVPELQKKQTDIT